MRNALLLPYFLLTAAILFRPSEVRAQQSNDSHLVASQWVRLETGSPLQGRFVVPQRDGKSVAVESATIALVGDDGAVARVISSNGAFKFENVKPGIYAVSASGKDAFATLALHVVDSNAPASEKYPTELELPAAKIDASTVNAAIVRYMPPVGSNGNSVGSMDADLGMLASRVLGEVKFRVFQNGEGMKGVIYAAGADREALPPAAYHNVFIYQNGEEVVRTVADQFGKFTIDELPLGEYSLLSVGDYGLGVVGFELVAAHKQAAISSIVSANGETLAAAIQPCCQVQTCCDTVEFTMQCAPMPEVVECVEGVVEEGVVTEDVVISEEVIGDVGMDAFGAPIPGGGYAPGGGAGYGGGYGGGGYGGGGGGFGGGGGGLLGLAAIGGIAAAAIAAADDDDNNPLPIIASPARP